MPGSCTKLGVCTMRTTSAAASDRWRIRSSAFSLLLFRLPGRNAAATHRRIAASPRDARCHDRSSSLSGHSPVFEASNRLLGARRCSPEVLRCVQSESAGPATSVLFRGPDRRSRRVLPMRAANFADSHLLSVVELGDLAPAHHTHFEQHSHASVGTKRAERRAFVSRNHGW
jgi:hypothetical protein